VERVNSVCEVNESMQEQSRKIKLLHHRQPMMFQVDEGTGFLPTKPHGTALLEDCHEQLDEVGQEHIDRIRNASQQMEQLIQDTLNLAYITRSKMRQRQVNLSTMAEELKKTNPRRKVVFRSTQVMRAPALGSTVFLLRTDCHMARSIPSCRTNTASYGSPPRIA